LEAFFSYRVLLVSVESSSTWLILQVAALGCVLGLFGAVSSKAFLMTDNGGAFLMKGCSDFSNIGLTN
jgi:hypothetical protein